MRLLERCIFSLAILLLTNTAAFCVVSQEELKAKIEEDLLAAVVLKYPFVNRADVEISVINLHELMLRLPKDAQKIETHMKDQGDILGRTIVRVNFYNREAFLDHYSVLVNVDAKASFYTVIRPLDQGVVIQEADIKEQKQTLIGANREAVHLKKDILGKELRFKVHQDNIIVSWMLKGESIVHEGDLLDSHFKNKDVELMVKSMALEDGKKGDKIRVKLLHNNRIAIAKILEKDHVAIYTNF